MELREPDPGPDIDPPVDDVPAESAEPQGRRYPSTIGGMFYILVLVVVAGALVVAAVGDGDLWRTGIRIMGGALIFGALVRLVLRARDAGMLAVRHKALDMSLLAGLGAALIFLAASIPDQPGL